MSERDTIPAPADRPTNPGQPDTASGPTIDILDRVFTKLALIEATHNEWGAQIVEQLAKLVTEVQAVARQFALITEKFEGLEMGHRKLRSRVARVEARLNLLDPSDDDTHGTNGNGSLPPEQ